MGLDTATELILIAVLIALNAFFAASEIAVISVPKLRLKQLMEEGNQQAALVFRLADDSSRFLATIQIGVTLMGFLASATAAVNISDNLAALIAAAPVKAIAASAQTIAVLVITIFLTIVMLVLGELVPKSIALGHSERLAFLVAPIIDFVARAFAPLVWFLVGVTNLIAKPLGGAPRRGMPVITEEEIKTMVDAGEEGGVIEEDEKEMIYSIFEFGDTLAREVMVPRIDVVAVEAATPIGQALEVIIHAGHSRVPVYQDTIDNIIGLLYAKDLLAYLRDGRTDIPLQDIVRPAYFVPEAKKVDELLEELQKQRTHMAIVVDEYGGVAGLVTVEDILEEIVGEIQDEYDVEEPLVELVGADEYVMNARLNLGDVSHLLNVTLPAESGDTLGGFIYSQLGRVPANGDQLHFGDLRLEVLSVSGRRIGKVRVQHVLPSVPPATTPQETNHHE